MERNMQDRIAAESLCMKSEPQHMVSPALGELTCNHWLCSSCHRQQKSPACQQSLDNAMVQQ